MLLTTVLVAVTSGRTLYFLAARGESFPWWRIVTFGLVTWWLWAIAGVVIWRRVLRAAPQWSDWKRVALAHLPFALFFSVARSIALSLLGKFMMEEPGQRRPLSEWITSYIVTQTPFDLLIYVSVIVASIAFCERRRALAREVEQERLTAQLVQAELRALRMQLQPHFLFNTLHAIGILIDEQPARARRMIVLLGDLLRGTLLADGASIVSLSHELDFARRYLDIEAVRFEDRLRVHIDVPDALLPVRVPNFLLQPLVENAIHHGINHLATAGEITITAHADGATLVIDVCNDGVLQGDASATGVGLAATRARLAKLHGARAHVTLEPHEGRVRARITLPVVNTDNVA